MIAITHTELAAVKLSSDIHNFLTANRARYNATHWSDINKGELDEWMVKIPYDYQRFVKKLDISKLETTKPMPEIGIAPLLDKYYLDKGTVYKCASTLTKDSLASFTVVNKEVIDIKPIEIIKDPITKTRL